MSTSDVTRALREAIGSRLRSTRPTDAFRYRSSARSLTLSVESKTRSTWSGELSWTVLASRSSVSLNAFVGSSPLQEVAGWLALPKGSRRIGADATLAWNSTGDPSNRFSSDQSGAEPIHYNSDIEALASKVVTRGVEHYLPLIHATLSLAPALATQILALSEYFAYPKVYLAILEAGGVSHEYSRAICDPRYRRTFKREHSIDMGTVFSTLRERERELGEVVELAQSHMPSTSSWPT